MSTTITTTFPTHEVEKRLRDALKRLARDNRGMREPWEPEFDSLAVVGIVLVLEDLFPFPLAPEKIVKKGGYSSEDDAVQDMTMRSRGQWDKHHA